MWYMYSSLTLVVIALGLAQKYDSNNQSTKDHVHLPPNKSLGSFWLAGQLVVIPLLKWPYFQAYHIEYFKIAYDKRQIYDNNTAMIILAENIDFRSFLQMHKIEGCACAGNAGNVFPATAV